MDIPEGKQAWMVKIGEKGQFVIPKEAREQFGFLPGETVLVVADKDRGLAIPNKEVCNRYFSLIFKELSGEGE